MIQLVCEEPKCSVIGSRVVIESLPQHLKFALQVYNNFAFLEGNPMAFPSK